MEKIEKTIKPKIEKLELNEAYIKVIYWFFSFPTRSISLSELAKELKISKRRASIIVSSLISEGFLIKEEIGRSWRLSCNQHHIYNYTRKISYNLSLVYSLLYELKLIDEIYKISGQPKAVILFGSYRKGDDIDKSDLDLAVEVINDEEIKIINLGKIPELGYRKNIPVNLHIFSRKKIDLNLFNNVANGIVLEGFLEVKK
ncbi:nucleotidyltransferase domain-containing protein [Candidatus Woesearchaeota archaeon]|nr:nucleotidyltransferase domain-containing protein [Candidatus Woesearchaeota archaeon]